MMIFLLIACICGWFVMELEILGVRMLAPFFGSAVYVVTGSVIGVFLLSLAIGYVLGGWLSKSIRRQTALGTNILVSGLCVILLPFVDEAVCDSIFRIGLDEKWGSLIASLCLFGLPTMMLGTVSPIVIRICENRKNNSGFTSGLVLAGSTVASFAGCVITAFYLVLVSLSGTLIISGLLLTAMGSAIMLGSNTLSKERDELQAQTDVVEAI